MDHELKGAVDLADGDMASFDAGGIAVLVCRVGGNLYAIEDMCSHQAMPLSEGMLDGYTVTCPLHFAEFDVRSGEATGPPAFTGARTFPITSDGVVTIEADDNPPPVDAAPSIR